MKFEVQETKKPKKTETENDREKKEKRLEFGEKRLETEEMCAEINEKNKIERKKKQVCSLILAN